MSVSDAKSKASKYFGRGLKTAVKIGITVAIFVIIASMVDGEALMSIVRQANLGLLLFVPLMGLPLVVLDSVRWTQVMKGLGRPLSLLVACRYSLVGLFFSNLAPGFIGFDGFRAVQMRRLNVPLPKAVQSVTFDRLSAFASLLVIILIFAPYTLTRIDNPAFLVVGSTVVALGAGFYFALILLHFGRDWVTRWLPHALVSRAAEQLTTFVRLFAKPKIAVPILLSGIAVHVYRASVVFVIAAALSIEMTLMDSIALVPMALLIAMVPISFGDWGVREAVFVVALANIGLTPEEALATSICFGLYRLCTGAMGGLAFLAMKKSHFALQPAN